MLGCAGRRCKLPALSRRGRDGQRGHVGTNQHGSATNYHQP